MNRFLQFLIIIIFFAAIIFNIVAMFKARELAQQKNQDTSFCMALCFFLGVIGYVIVAAMPDLHERYLLQKTAVHLEEELKVNQSILFQLQKINTALEEQIKNSSAVNSLNHSNESHQEHSEDPVYLEKTEAKNNHKDLLSFYESCKTAKEILELFLTQKSIFGQQAIAIEVELNEIKETERIYGNCKNSALQIIKDHL